MPHMLQPFFFLSFLRRSPIFLFQPLMFFCFTRLMASAPSGTSLVIGGACADGGVISHFHRGHQLHIRSDKDPITDDRLMFLESIVVAGDGPGPDIDLFSNDRISDIGEVVGFGTSCR